MFTMILRVLKHMHIHTCAHAYEGTALPGYTGPYLQGGGLIFQLLPCCTISVSSVCLCFPGDPEGEWVHGWGNYILFLRREKYRTKDFPAKSTAAASPEGLL